ncbi:MAG: GNAT family N-acetyltransferase [Anaerolineae bacterium]|nr:MAG: GNAT family N-acetyltransferase [Anaerolineae bacterium]
MSITLLTTAQEFDDLENEWNALLSRSAQNLPFLRHEYLSTWWQTRGGEEWRDGDLFIVTLRSEAGQLNGIAPLFRTRNAAGEQAVMFLGSYEISDYLDFIASPEHLSAIIEATLDVFLQPDAPAWDVLDFYNLLEDSPSLPVLEAAAARRGLQFQRENLQVAPRIVLPSTWDEYLMQIEGKQRREIRRKLRRAAAYFAPVSWYIVEDESALDAEFDDFLELMAYDPEKQAFLTEVMRSQMRSAVHTAFKAGWLQLAFLTVGGKKAAAYLNFDYDNKIWVYNSGLNFEFQELSPGWVLLAHLIQWAIEHGRTVFDMMRGDEVYKYRFGGVDRLVQRVRLTRAG